MTESEVKKCPKFGGKMVSGDVRAYWGVFSIMDRDGLVGGIGFMLSTVKTAVALSYTRKRRNRSWMNSAKVK